MRPDQHRTPVRDYSKTLVGAAFAILILVGAWIIYDNHRDSQRAEELGRSNLDTVTEIIRDTSNRIEVYWIAGKATTVRKTSGGPFGVFDGELVIRQPFRVGYFVDMRRMTLSDYIWDEQSKTLLVRLPPAAPDPPSIDASKQEVQAKGWVITRDMQNRLRKSIAVGAQRQAQQEALKPENMRLADEGARKAIADNLAPALRAAGIPGVRVEVIARNGSSERWDMSRSIAEVLAERASR
jgi:hypothetical protein